LFLNLFGLVSVNEARYGIPNIIKYILSIYVLGIIIYYRLKNPAKPVPEGLFYPVIVAFVLWSLILLIFSILNFDGFFYLQRLFGQSYFFIPYLLPILLIYAKFNLEFFSHWFRYSFVFLIPAIVIQLYIIQFTIDPGTWWRQKSFILVFDIGSKLLLLTAHISKKKYISYTVLLYYLLWIFIWSVYGRRGALVNNLILLIFMIFMRMRSSFVKRADRMKIYFSGLLLIILILAFGYLITSTYVFQRGFNQNAFQESRGSVFEGFFYDFRSSSDWIFGRGLNGTVLRSLYSSKEFTEIENGFLTILLKGGLLYLVPYLIILLRAAYLGFLRSENDFDINSYYDDECFWVAGIFVKLYFYMDMCISLFHL
jgi:hypothetical protein